MKVYLAGPMSNYPELNFPHFREMASLLRDQGHDVVNPAEINADKTTPWLDCMRMDIEQLIYCEAIALLDGWEKSRGAMVEHTLATGLGMPAYSAYALAKVPAASLIQLKVLGEVKS